MKRYKCERPSPNCRDLCMFELVFVQAKQVGDSLDAGLHAIAIFKFDKINRCSALGEVRWLVVGFRRAVICPITCMLLHVQQTCLQCRKSEPATAFAQGVTQLPCCGDLPQLFYGLELEIGGEPLSRQSGPWMRTAAQPRYRPVSSRDAGTTDGVYTVGACLTVSFSRGMYSLSSERSYAELERERSERRRGGQSCAHQAHCIGRGTLDHWKHLIDIGPPAPSRTHLQHGWSSALYLWPHHVQLLNSQLLLHACHSI